MLKGRDSGNVYTFGWSGLLFGLAFLFKQPELMFGLLGFAIMLRDAFATKGSARVEHAKRFGFYCAGMALPYLLTCAWMARAGTFSRFWFWIVVYAQSHSQVQDGKMGMINLGIFYKLAGVCLRLSWLAALGGITWFILSRKAKDASFIVLALLLVSLVAFVAGFYFTPHYFVMVLPAISLGIAVLACGMTGKMGKFAAASCFVLACAGCVYANRASWFEQSPDAASRVLYGPNPFPEAVDIAKYLQDHTVQSDTVGILGSEPEIFFYSHRHSATGYIYMYDLVQPQQYAATMQRETVQQIESAKPAYLLLVNVPMSWCFLEGADKGIIDWFNSYSRTNYDNDGMVWIYPDHTEYCWSKEALTKKFDYSAIGVLVMKRKPGI